MTKLQACTEARKVAQTEHISMVVTYTQDGELPEEERYSYFPAVAEHIFYLDKVVERIEPLDLSAFRV